MAKLRPGDVFTPSAFPTLTYVEREERRFEGRLRDALETPGQVVSLSGPSKSGKTVLVERVVGQDLLITVTGAGLDAPEELWDRVLDWLVAPSDTSSTESTSVSASTGGSAKGSMGVPLIATGEVEANAAIAGETQSVRTSTRRRRGLAQVVEEIGDSDYVLLIDDFHYMPKSVQSEVAKQIKEAARQGVKIVTASVPHRSDDVVRANPELRGRLLALDLDYWSTSSLREIAEKGFNELRVELDNNSVDHFVREAAGSPQLMQGICLNTCFEMGIREQQPGTLNLEGTPDDRRSIFERTAATTDFRSLVAVLDSGPKTRGVERKSFDFADGTTGDVYRCILKALALDPPVLTFDYDQVQRRIRNLCTGDSPLGSSITGSIVHICRLAEEKFPQERVIDWDEDKQVFDISDPYLLFYLRWSGHLDA